MTTHRIHTRAATGRVSSTTLVSTDPEVVDARLEDAAHFPGGHATGVARPRTEADVAELLRRGHQLLAVGAQSSLTGGATPRGDVVVATDGLSEVIEVSQSRVRVQTGVSLRTLQTALDIHGAWYPPVPTYDGAAVGGVVATNAAGPATFKYGATRAWVTGLSVVLGGGDVLDIRRGEVVAHPEGYFDIERPGGVCRVPVPGYRMPDVPKRSAGYFAEPGMDLVDLFVGSEGTLGIITEVTLDLVPRKPAASLWWVPMRDESRAGSLVTTLREAARTTWRTNDPHGIDVASIEHLDRRSLAIVREDGAARMHHVSIPADTSVALLLEVELPPSSVRAGDVYEEIGRALEPGAPDTPVTRLCRMLADADVLDRVEVALPDDHRRRRQLLAVREAVPEGVNRRIAAAQRLHPDIRKTAADMIVPYARFDDSVSVFRTTFERLGLDFAIWGHISDGNLHPNVIPTSLDEVTLAETAILDCGRAIIEMGGCPLAEHGVGRHPVKQALLHMLYGTEGLAEMRRVKAALDPDGQLAPGVLFPAAGRPELRATSRRGRTT